MRAEPNNRLIRGIWWVAEVDTGRARVRTLESHVIIRDGRLIRQHPRRPGHCMRVVSCGGTTAGGVCVFLECRLPCMAFLDRLLLCRRDQERPALDHCCCRRRKVVDPLAFFTWNFVSITSHHITSTRTATFLSLTPPFVSVLWRAVATSGRHGRCECEQ
jgi:hypothetical protein